MLGFLNLAGQVVADILLGVYLLLVVVNLVVALIHQIRPLKSLRAAQPQLNALLTGVLSKPSFTTYFTLVTLTYSLAVAWPVNFEAYEFARKRKTDLQVAAWRSLRPPDLRLAICNLVVLAVVLGFAALHLGWYPIELVLVGAVLVAIAARHASYLLGPLMLRLRRSRLNPGQTFVAIAVADIASLILGVAALFESARLLHPTPADFLHSVIDLSPWGRVVDLSTLSLSRVPVTVLALLAYGVLIKTLLTLGEIRRTDDDVRSVAMAFLVLGEYTRARGWLDLEGQPNADSLVYRAVIEIALQQFDRALAYGRQSRQVKHEDEGIDSVLLPVWSASLLAPLEAATRAQFMAKEIGWGAADGSIAGEIDGCLAFAIVPRELLEKELWSKLTENQYPIARSLMLFSQDRYDEAISLLERATPGSDIEEVQRLANLFVIRSLKQVHDDEPYTTIVKGIIDWKEHDLPTLRDLALSLNPPWRRAALSIVFLLRNYLRQLGTAITLDPAALSEFRDMHREISELIQNLEDREGQVQQQERIWAGMYRLEEAP